MTNAQAAANAGFLGPKLTHEFSDRSKKRPYLPRIPRVHCIDGTAERALQRRKQVNRGRKP